MQGLFAQQFDAHRLCSNGLTLRQSVQYGCRAAQGVPHTQALSAEAAAHRPKQGRPAADHVPSMIGGPRAPGSLISTGTTGNRPFQFRPDFSNRQRRISGQCSNGGTGLVMPGARGLGRSAQRERMAPEAVVSDGLREPIGLPDIEGVPGLFEFGENFADLTSHIVGQFSIGFHALIFRRSSLDFRAFQPPQILGHPVVHPRRSLGEQPEKLRADLGDRRRRPIFNAGHCRSGLDQGATTGPERRVLGHRKVSLTKMRDRSCQHVGLPRMRLLRDGLDMVEGVLNLLGNGEERSGFLFAGHGLS